MSRHVDRAVNRTGEKGVVKIAGVQFDVQRGNCEENLRRMTASIAEAGDGGAQLVIFPECALTGYCFDSRMEAFEFAETIPGPAVEALSEACRQHDIFALFGLLEREGTALYNAAAVVGPRGLVGSYRKIHLPFLGVDRFADPGDRPFAVHDLDGMRLGIGICYDASFPEAARCLALQGADLIAIPTNWPPGSECAADCLVRARALENAVYCMAVNRVGEEGGFPFIGQSQVADPSGRWMHRASETAEEMFLVTLDLEKARRKHLVRVAGAHEIDRFADRRPELYGPITAPHRLTSPGRSRP